MSITWNRTVIIVSNSCWGITRKLGTDASDRSDVYNVPLFWKSANVPVFTKISGFRCKSQTNTATYAIDEIGGHLSSTTTQSTRYGTSQIPLFTARIGNCASQSSLGYRYHLSSLNGGICLSGCTYRLVQPFCFVLRSFYNAGLSILSFCISCCTTNGKSRNSQFRSRSTIYLQCLYKCSIASRNTNQYGWKGPGIRQCFYRKVMADSKIRKCLYQRLPFTQRSLTGLERLFQVLQLRKATFCTKWKNSLRNIWCKMKEHCIIVAGGKVGEKIPPHPPLRIYYINSNLEELLNVYLPKSERPTLRPTLFCLTFGVHFILQLTIYFLC